MACGLTRLNVFIIFFRFIISFYYLVFIQTEYGDQTHNVAIIYLHMLGEYIHSLHVRRTHSLFTLAEAYSLLASLLIHSGCRKIKNKQCHLLTIRYQYISYKYIYYITHYLNLSMHKEKSLKKCNIKLKISCSITFKRSYL